MELGSKPTVTINKDTLLNELIEIAGGINIAREARTRYPLYSQEEVVVQSPDVVISVTMDGNRKDAAKLWSDLLKHQRTYIIDADLLCNLSPRVIEGLKELALAIHPENKE